MNLKQNIKNILAYFLSRPLLIAAIVIILGFTVTTIWLAVANRSLRQGNKELTTQIAEVQAENERLEQAVKEREKVIEERTVIADSLKANLKDYREKLIVIDESGTNIRNADMEYHIDFLTKFLNRADSLAR